MFNYISRKISKLPYAITVSIPSVFWSILCAGFGLLIILSKANFQTTGTRDLFILSIIVYVMIAALLASVESGILRLFGIKKERKDLKILNDNIKNGHIRPDVSNEVLKKIYNFLIISPKEAAISSAKYVSLVITLTAVTEWWAGESGANILIIVEGGLISLFLSTLFVNSFSGYSIFSVLKECRRLLRERNEEVIESKYSWGLKTMFISFLSFPILIVFIILEFFSSLTLKILIPLLFGFFMAMVISQVFYSLIYRVFLDVGEFAKKLPQKEKIIFSTGTSNNEVMDLSKGLNLTAEEIYLSRKKLEEAKNVLEIRVRARTWQLREQAEALRKENEEKTKALRQKLEELERFSKLTVGRELRMIELKKEIKKLKEEMRKKENKD